MSEGVESLVVRAMAASDLDRVLTIAMKLDQAPQWPRAIYESMFDPAHAGRRIALVAEEADSGELAGFAVAGVVPPEAELESIGVSAAYQRRGIGGRLVKEMATILRRRGITKVHLEVRDSNRAAKGLYGSLGFRESGSRPGYYADPIEDAIGMHLDLRVC
jgi:[ribosomal protein S18]-alanine N-acetyltransferase